jgi:hypothetical protein
MHLGIPYCLVIIRTAETYTGAVGAAVATFVFCFSTSAQGRQYSVMAVSNFNPRREQYSLPPKIKGTSVFLQEVHCMGVSGEALD